MPSAGPAPNSGNAEFLPDHSAGAAWQPSSAPLCTASSRSCDFTTAPAGNTSILTRPPLMSFTFLA